MLGFKKNTTPVCPEASAQIRQTAFRIATGNLNESDLAAIERSRIALSRYSAVWK